MNVRGRRSVLPKINIPNADLVVLDRLTLEILRRLISLLDIATLDKFKLTSRLAFQVTNDHPPLICLEILSVFRERSVLSIKRRLRAGVSSTPQAKH